ncbi:hypothetical protein Droror1_Dr00009144 [Drosera rotundifolia]
MDEIAAYYAAAPPPPPGTRHHHDPYSPPPPHPIPLHHQQAPLVILTPAPSNLRVRPSAHVSLHHPPPIHSPYSQVISVPRSEDEDEVRTLFVAGLPADVKAREIYHLFREFPGYQSSNIRRRSERGQPFAFAVFADQRSAIDARHALNGMQFDLEKGSTLYINLAKANSKAKRFTLENEDPGSDKRFKASAAFSRGSADPGVGGYHVPGMSNSAYNMIGYSSTQSRLSYDTRIIGQTSSVKPSTLSSPHALQNNPPCPTIFVANLGPACTERELTQIFSSCRGFLKLKMQNSRGAPVAFVDFEDTASSSEALGQLQGAILRSSTDGEGMRLEYAKSRMGLRRK